MSSAAIPICYVDSEAFGDTVVLTNSYDYTSDDGLTTSTGTATWTYTRARLSDLVACPKLLWCENPGSLSLDTGQFVAVRCGVGSIPGWIVIFGLQDPVIDAITTTVSSDDPDTPPVVTHGDAFVDSIPTATCALIAPGVRTGARAGNDLNTAANRVMLLGINRGVLANNSVPNASFDVALIQPGIAADAATKRPAVPPVYRVTIPTEAGLVDGSGFTIHLNGAMRSGGVDNLTDLATVLESLSEGQWVVEPRSPWVCDVQLADPTDTLAAGTLDYVAFVQQDSQVAFSGGVQTIDDPFPMTGQSFTVGPDESGLTSTIQF